MKELVAKKYVNALMQAMETRELEDLLLDLQYLSHAYTIEKFRTIIDSSDVPMADKVELLLSMLESPSEKLTNLIKLLSANDRLAILPEIKRGLEYQLALNKNQFKGSVTGMFALTEAQVKELESSFSKKFDATIQLTSQQSDYPGIKVALDDLGVEVSFSVQRLKSQLTDHILKAI
jgi:F-type H+-transporting ATPase subunit delta